MPQSKSTTLEKGEFLIEIIIGAVIIAILATIAVYSLSNFRRGQTIPTSVDTTVSLLNEARSRTLSGDNAMQYGVHLQSTQIVLFSGATYSSGATSNKKIVLDPSTTITSISLAGGGSDVVFTKLTGETTQYGTLIVKDISTTVGQKTITISKTGLVSVN